MSCIDNCRVVRKYELFDNQLTLIVSIDKTEVLSIVVDMNSLQFATPLIDCSLDVLAKESTIICNLISSFHLGDC